MRTITRSTLVLAFGLFTLVLGSGQQQNAKDQESSVRQCISVVPAYRRCEPAEVKFVSMGRQPKEAILAQVTIENRSDKIITAVKLGWRVYSEEEGLKISLSSCTAPPPSAEVFLSGATPLIQLDVLGPKETSHIAIDPLPVPVPADKTVFIDRAIISVDDLKALTANKYAAVVFVSEIHYGDGTRWTTESK
ncbi:MAG TPA: hypothetical protein VJU86_06335 [Pyrinomonadaceae bacterium]|nr:hypothetical protein [Pyrinomonadaceae bacterium]